MGHFQPIDGTVLPRFAGVASFMRLPVRDLDRLHDVDIGLIGVPWDCGTTNRPGARHGPRALRDASTLTRNQHAISGVKPYQLCNCADLGDVVVNPVHLGETLERIEAFFARVHQAGVSPLVAGGDHLTTLPVLRGIARKKPLGLVHFDAHTDTIDPFQGKAEFTHGTPFFHAINEGLLDPRRVIQIGIRGSRYGDDDGDWGRKLGITVVTMEDFERLGPEAVVRMVHEVVGNQATYVTFDVDCLDPAFAMGTGTPEVGGFTTREALHLLRGLRGLDVVGADVVEVSPPFDVGGLTAVTGSCLLFELLCLLSEARARRGARAGKVRSPEQSGAWS